jgi:tetratricopeptide (TPR) repeat protein
MLADVFRELRSRGDASAALRALDDYDRQFPAGGLQSEARVARAEALLALDRRRDALPLLEGLEQAGFAPTRDLRVARGELLAEAGQCERAIGDFDAVVAVGDGDAVGGRALYARASCRLRAGAVELAREDLRRYLVTHPDGPSAAGARRALGVSPAP